MSGMVALITGRHAVSERVSRGAMRRMARAWFWPTSMLMG